MVNPDLQKYITSARQQGLTDDQIRQNLVRQGWPETEVMAVLSSATLPQSGVGNNGLIVRVILFALIFIVSIGVLQSTFIQLLVAYIPVLNISLAIGGPGVIFAMIYLPLSTYLITKKYKKNPNQTGLEHIFGELFYFVFILPSALILILQLFYTKYSDSFFVYSIGIGGLIIALLISSWIFFRNVKVILWRALILLVIGLAITFWFSPIKQVTSDTINVDSSITNFVDASHYSKITNITIALNNRDNNVKFFVVSFEDPTKGGTLIGGIYGLEHGSKIGWIDSYKKVKPEDENQRYHFDSSDDNLFTNEFLNKLGSQKELFVGYAAQDSGTTENQLLAIAKLATSATVDSHGFISLLLPVEKLLDNEKSKHNPEILILLKNYVQKWTESNNKNQLLNKIQILLSETQTVNQDSNISKNNCGFSISPPKEWSSSDNVTFRNNSLGSEIKLSCKPDGFENNYYVLFTPAQSLMTKPDSGFYTTSAENTMVGNRKAYLFSETHKTGGVENYELVLMIDSGIKNSSKNQMDIIYAYMPGKYKSQYGAILKEAIYSYQR